MRQFRWFVIAATMCGVLPVWGVHAQVLSGKIAYSTSTHEVWVMNGDGTASGKRKLADGDGSVFSPDGTRVAFISGAYAPVDVLHDIAIKSVKIDGTDVRDECVIGRGVPVYLGVVLTLLRWSPSGKYIAMNATQNGPGLVQLCDTTSHTMLDHLTYLQGTVALVFDWSADGGTVLFQAGPNYRDQKDVYLGDPDTLGDAAAKITNGALLNTADAGFAGYYYAGRLSPDGKTIAIAGSRLFFSAVPGQSSAYDARSIAIEAPFGFAWSPDSSVMAVVTTDGLLLVNVATGTFGPLLSGVTTVDWTRQGSAAIAAMNVATVQASTAPVSVSLMA